MDGVNNFKNQRARQKSRQRAAPLFLGDGSPIIKALAGGVNIFYFFLSAGGWRVRSHPAAA
jgi:hypothetical protein